MSADQSSNKPMPRHPVAGFFPAMTDEHYAGLKASLGSVGQQSPCLTWRGKLVDGVHRERACTELGIPCQYVQIEADDEADMIDKVAALNVHRRHLNTTQRGVAALKLKEAFAVAARERQKGAAKHGSKGGRPRKKTLAGMFAEKRAPSEQKAREATSSERAAAAVGVSARTVETVAAVAKKAPDLVPQMAAGKLSANAARSEVARRESAAAPLKPPPARRQPAPVRGKRSEMIERLSAMPGRDWRFLVASSARSHRGEIGELMDALREILDYDPGEMTGNADEAPGAGAAREEGYA